MALQYFRGCGWNVIAGISGCEWARGERVAAEEVRESYNRRMNGQRTARAELKETKCKRRYWAWLLVLPLLLLVYPGMYARTTPEVFGFPFFYWYQFAVVVATAMLTGLVYWLTRNRSDEGSADRSSS
jgi:cation transport ATPase